MREEVHQALSKGAGISVATSDIPSASDLLVWGREVTAPALRTAVETLDPALQTVVGYHFGWPDRQGRSSGGSGGKALRPTLVLLCAQAAGGSVQDGLPGAVATELLHNFSLLHDDIIDGDALRRGRASAWSFFGTTPALLAGDALLALAFDVLRNSPRAVAQLAFAAQGLVTGELADTAFEQRADVSLAEGVAMAQGKTAALVGGCASIGATLAGADSDQAAHLHGFGYHLGMAFQLVDDLLGIWGDPMVTGKPVGADLVARKMTLPVLAALDSATPAGQQLAKLYAADEPLSAEAVQEAADLVEAAGGRAWTERRIEQETEAALAQLAYAAPPPLIEEQLTGLARLMAGRDR